MRRPRLHGAVIRAGACLFAMLVACAHDAPDTIRRPWKPTHIRGACAVDPVCGAPRPPPPLDAIPQWAHIDAILRVPGDRIDLAALNLWISQARNPAVDVAANLATLDRMAREIERSLPHGRCDHRCRIAALDHYLFEQQHFRSEFDPSGLYVDVDRDLIDRVLATHVGYCEGLTFLYLALGQRLGIPLAAVAARQHMYVRYVGTQTAPFDIDPTQEGRRPVLPTLQCAAAPNVYGVAMDARTLAGHMLGLLAIAPGFISLPWLDRAVSLAPRVPDLRNNRAIERARALDTRGALEDYATARQLDPCAPLYPLNEAILRFGFGDREGADRLVDEVDARYERGEIDEGHPLVTLTRASFAFERGDDARVEQLLEDAYAESDGAPVVLEAVAAVRTGEGQLDQAVEAMRMAVARDPSVRTRVGLSLALIEDGRPGEALGQLYRASQEQPVTGALDLHIAMLAASLGEFHDAELAARRCLDRFGSRCRRALVVLGDVARERGQLGCAERYYDAFLSCPVPVRSRGYLRVEETVRARLATVRNEGADTVAMGM